MANAELANDLEDLAKTVRGAYYTKADFVQELQVRLSRHGIRIVEDVQISEKKP